MKSLSRVWLLATPWTTGSSSMKFFQARMLEWVTISFSRGSSGPRDWTQVSHTAGRLLTIWAIQEAQSESESCSVMSDSFRPHGLEPTRNPPTKEPTRLLCPWGFSKQEYWSRLPWPPLGDLPNPGVESRSPALQIDSLPSEPLGKPKNTGLGSLSLLQWIFPTRESNWVLLIAGKFFTSWATREAHSFNIEHWMWNLNEYLFYWFLMNWNNAC